MNMVRIVWPVTILSIVLAMTPLPIRHGLAAERVYRVAGVSMKPDLMPGDAVVVDDIFFEKNEPRRGNMVAIAFKNRKNPMVKRIAAISGDKVSFYDDTLWINKKAIRKINSGRWRSTIKQINHYGGVIPDKTLLVLGDNPQNSRDSRRLGLIGLDQIAGKVVRIIKNGRVLDL